MKFSKAILFGCFATATVATAIEQPSTSNIEKRQLSFILKELESAIESAADCAGCQVSSVTCLHARYGTTEQAGLPMVALVYSTHPCSIPIPFFLIKQHGKLGPITYFKYLCCSRSSKIAGRFWKYRVC